MWDILNTNFNSTNRKIKITHVFLILSTDFLVFELQKTYFCSTTSLDYRKTCGG